MIGCFAAIASFGYGFANFLNAALLSTPGCAFLSFASASNDGMVACSITCVAAWTALNCVRIDKVGWLNELAAVLHLVSIVVISVLVLVLPVTVNSAPDNTRLASISSVFTKWNNDTGFDSPVYVVCIGLLYGLYGFEGFEASAHLAEEVSSCCCRRCRSHRCRCQLHVSFADRRRPLQGSQGRGQHSDADGLWRSAKLKQASSLVIMATAAAAACVLCLQAS